MWTQERGKGKEGGDSRSLVCASTHPVFAMASTCKERYVQSAKFNGMYLCLGMHACPTESR